GIELVNNRITSCFSRGSSISPGTVPDRNGTPTIQEFDEGFETSASGGANTANLIGVNNSATCTMVNILVEGNHADNSRNGIKFEKVCNSIMRGNLTAEGSNHSMNFEGQNSFGGAPGNCTNNVVER